jgi:hypothetical protein
VIYISSSALIVFTILNDLLIFTVGDILGNLTFVLFLIFSFAWNSRVYTKEANRLKLILNKLLQIGIYAVIVLILVLASNNIVLK